MFFNDRQSLNKKEFYGSRVFNSIQGRIIEKVIELAFGFLRQVF